MMVVDGEEIICPICGWDLYEHGDRLRCSNRGCFYCELREGDASK